MASKISFVNNTNSQITINGMAANAMSLCQDAIDCANGSYVLNPGIGFATLSSTSLPLFELSAPDFVFNVPLSQASTSQIPFHLPENVLGGANQANYAGTLFLDNGVYTILIQDLTSVQSVTFVNNTQDDITLQDMEGNSLYTVSNGTSKIANIGNLPIFQTIQLCSTDFTFNVVLGINSIMPDLNPPANQSNYIAGLSYSNNEYVITVSNVDSKSSVIFQNLTGEEITIQPIGRLRGGSLFTDLHDGLIQAVDQSYAILPGIGSGTVDSSITQLQLTTDDFAFIFTLSGAGKVDLPQLKGVNQSQFAANISQNGTQYTIVISPSPLIPTIQFINNTADVINIENLKNPNAITNCLDNLDCTNGSFVLNPGAGSFQIGDFADNQQFNLVATDFTFSVNLSDLGKIVPTPSANYVGLVNQIGNLYTVVIEKGTTPPGPGSAYSFTFTGSVGETLFFQKLTQADYNTISNNGKEPTSLSVSLTGSNAASLTSCCKFACSDTDNCLECNPLNINSPSVFSLCSSLTGVASNSIDLVVELNSSPSTITVSTGRDLSNTNSEAVPFVFPLNQTGTVSVVLSNSATEKFPDLQQPLNLAANYSFIAENDTGSLREYNVGTISSTGVFSFMFASTIPNTFNNTMKVDGTISIKDASGVPITFTISESQQSSLTGSASFGSITGVPIGGQLEMANGKVLIQITGTIKQPLPQFNNSNSLTGSVSLNFYS